MYYVLELKKRTSVLKTKYTNTKKQHVDIIKGYP